MLMPTLPWLPAVPYTAFRSRQPTNAGRRGPRFLLLSALSLVAPGAAVVPLSAAAAPPSGGATIVAGTSGLADPAATPQALRRADLVRVPLTAPLAAALARAGSADAWFAWAVPQQPATGTSCCYQSWQGGRRSARGCSLEGDSIDGMLATGSATEKEVLLLADDATPERLEVYVRVDAGGQLERVHAVSAGCPVDAGGRRVTWLTGVPVAASVDLLAAAVQGMSGMAGGEEAARGGRRQSPDGARSEVADGALVALAHHGDVAADRALGALARGRGDRRDEARFWLGVARGVAGFAVLRELVGEVPAGEREELTFALAQSPVPAARSLLRRLAGEDPVGEVRAQAMFWLAQENDEEAVATIRAALRRDRDADVREQAVFALSQLPDGRGTDELLALLRDPELSAEVRQKALFWLAQSDDPRAAAAVDRLLAN